MSKSRNDKNKWSNEEVAQKLTELNELRIALVKAITLQVFMDDDISEEDALAVSQPIPPALNEIITPGNARRKLAARDEYQTQMQGYLDYIHQLEEFCDHIDDIDEQQLRVAQAQIASAGAVIGDGSIHTQVDLLAPNWETMVDAEEETVELQTDDAFTPRDSQPKIADVPFTGYSDQKGKTTGANHPGPYGGIWKNDADGSRAMFKRDTVGQKIRVGKIIGEYVAGKLTAALLAEVHGPAYSDQYVADVELVRAKQSNPNETDADLVYLKSTFLKNYQGDFWQVAFVDRYRHEIIDNIPQGQVTPKLVAHAHTLAEHRVEAEFGGDKPKAVKHALLGKHTHPSISVPSNALLEKEDTWLVNYCDQVAARLLPSDYGIHPGNFGIVKNDKNELQVASLDYGAAFLNLKENVHPFTRNPAKTGTKLYKNHLMEYLPAVYLHEKMADAFIKIGKVSDAALDGMIDSILANENVPYESPKHIQRFCKRLGMPEESYKDAPSKDNLLPNIRDFLRDKLKSRKESILQLGYGLKLEHWYKQYLTDKNKGALLNHLASIDSEFGEFIQKGLDRHQPLLDLPGKAKFDAAFMKAAYRESQSLVAEHSDTSMQIDEDTVEATADESQTVVAEPPRKRPRYENSELYTADASEVCAALNRFTAKVNQANQKLEEAINLLKAANEKLEHAGTKRKAPMKDPRVSQASVFASSSNSEDATNEPNKEVNKRAKNAAKNTSNQ